ncbi:hypothetical protein Bpfe_031033 [Biomphalaria pfeifferi]|uniref:Uncharacterized protein n=1 Tax=Biomphalaria pfeifferi TaxID=112525 RepID=A0AAD8APR3_BIOPF|nr:hypothetical protein Bpfe_031033 [Biomphalaria pfeifferi]
MSEKIKLKVSGEITQEVVQIDPETKKEVTVRQRIEYVSQGEHGAELKPDSIIETSARKFADWLIREYGLEEIQSAEAVENDAASNEFEAQYPADFPARKVFIENQITIETARNLDRESLIKIDGIAEKSADKILNWFVEHPAN